MTKPTWSEYYLGIAEAASKRSSCERSRVGAVVVKNNRVVGVGYNDAPAGKPGCESCPRRSSTVEPGSDYDSGSGKCVSLHAEQNAVLYCSREDLIGATIYVTREPCFSCSKLIEGAGITKVVYPKVEISTATRKCSECDHLAVPTGFVADLCRRHLDEFEAWREAKEVNCGIH